jgi:peptide/nickel transport system substrate-binding protein
MRTRSTESHLHDPRKNGAWRWGLFVGLVVVFGFIASLIVPRITLSGALGPAGQEESSASVQIGLTGAPSSLDPRTNTAAARILLTNVYQGLTQLNAKNQPIPCLAQSWTISPDGKTYTFHLKGNQKFSTGKTVTSQDVVTSLSTLARINRAAFNQFSSLAHVSNPTRSTVIMQLTTPDPALLWKLATPLGMVMDFSPSTTFSPDRFPAGSGPYALSTISTDSGHKTIRLQYNPSYTGADGNHAHVGTVTFTYFPSQEAEVKAYKSGSVQAALDIGPDQYRSAKKDHTLANQLVVGPTTTQAVIAFNGADNSLMSDKRLRQTQRMIMNRSDAIRAVAGLGTELGGPIGTLDPGYENLTRQFPVDLNQGIRLQSYYLQRARHWKIAVSSDFPQSVIDSLSASEKAASDTLTPVRLNSQQWAQQITNSKDGKMQMDMAAWIDHGSHTAQQWFSGTQWWMTDNPTADRDYHTAITSANTTDYESGIKKAARTLVVDQPATWLYQLKTASLWKSDLTGIPTSRIDDWVDLTHLSEQD